MSSRPRCYWNTSSPQTRKLQAGPGIARRKIELFSRLNLVEIGLETILGAIDLRRFHHLILLGLPDRPNRFEQRLF